MQIRELASRVAGDPNLAARLQADPVGELQNLAAEPAYRRDRWIYRLVAGVLGLIALVAAVGAIWLALEGTDIPDLLVALGSAAVGALAGLFNPVQSSSTDEG